jgi:hypothetical protein
MIALLRAACTIATCSTQSRECKDAQGLAQALKVQPFQHNWTSQECWCTPPALGIHVLMERPNTTVIAVQNVKQCTDLSLQLGTRELCAGDTILCNGV